MRAMLHQPPNRAWYLMLPLVSSTAMGAGGMLLHLVKGSDLGSSMMFGLGLALLNAPFAGYVAIDRVGSEWKAYWEYRREQVRVLAPVPEPQEPEPEEWIPMTLPTGTKAYRRADTPARAVNAFGATADTFTTIHVVNDADETTDQIETVDVSWGMWTLAVNWNRVGGWSERAWAKARIFSSVEVYCTIRDYMVSRHLLKWKNIDHHNAGIEITRAGEAAFSALRKMAKAPSPIHVPVTGKNALRTHALTNAGEMYHA